MRHLTGRQVFNLIPKHDDWYRISNKASETTAEIYLYDEIGWFGTTANDFVDELKTVTAPSIDLHISSVGGDIFDGVAIYNALRTHPALVTSVVDSMAASIASVITQAGDRRVMLTGSQMMIHEAQGFALGNSADMRDLADILDRQTDLIAEIYAEASGGSGKKNRFLSLMREETWFNASEAVAEGLADEVVKPQKETQRVEQKQEAPDWVDLFRSMKLDEEEMLHGSTQNTG